MRCIMVLHIFVLASLLSLLGAAMPVHASRQKTAIFAGGCFWCMEPPFTQLDGVLAVTAGYTGGRKARPTYEQVSSGKTGHYEAVRVIYDPERISYAALLEVFWRQVDPTDQGGQFADRGTQYGTAIFYGDEEQRRQAEESRRHLDQSGVFDRPVVTAILPATAFYEAEEYHQGYARKNVLQYTAYKDGSGRAGQGCRRAARQYLQQAAGRCAAQNPDSASVLRHPGGGYRATLQQPLLAQQGAGNLCGCCLWRAAVFLQGQV